LQVTHFGPQEGGRPPHLAWGVAEPPPRQNSQKFLLSVLPLGLVGHPHVAQKGCLRHPYNFIFFFLKKSFKIKKKKLWHVSHFEWCHVVLTLNSVSFEWKN
jgi:hypothetical protein